MSNSQYEIYKSRSQNLHPANSSLTIAADGAYQAMSKSFSINWVDEDNLARSQTIIASQERWLLGRALTSDVVLSHPSVSRVHAEFVFEEGQISVRDLNSRYGTRVNGILLEPGQSRTLYENVELRLGHLTVWLDLSTDQDVQAEMLQTCFFTQSKTNQTPLSEDLSAIKNRLIQRLRSGGDIEALASELEVALNRELTVLQLRQEEQLKEQKILNSISHVLNRSQTLPELGKSALNLLGKVLSTDRALFLIQDESEQQCRVIAQRNFNLPDSSHSLEQPVVFSHQLVQRALKDQKPTFQSNLKQCNQAWLTESLIASDAQSVLVIPLILTNKVLGLIYLDSASQAECFESKHLPFLETFATHTAIALNNAQLYRRAITDDLTHLYHRKYIDERIDQELERAKRYQRPFSILLLDLDHFKSINDNYGHAAGDMVLQRVSNELRQKLRDTDIAGRMGGEEFIVILGETDLAGARWFAERIRESIENLSMTKDEQEIRITVSIGLASFCSRYIDQRPLMIEDADKALYQAKREGRNRVIAF